MKSCFGDVFVLRDAFSKKIIEIWEITERIGVTQVLGSLSFSDILGTLVLYFVGLVRFAKVHTHTVHRAH